MLFSSSGTAMRLKLILSITIEVIYASSETKTESSGKCAKRALYGAARPFRIEFGKSIGGFAEDHLKNR